ncbi:MAG: haloacid dehalogenase-like hydrolase [Clostridia bacterium]|nr:haloacid dehalogenase-like hydrolase [Clostridia bacterium]
MAKAIVALIYDFDNTLSTRDMQEFTFIPALGMEADDFWDACGDFARKNETDSILTYMYLMAKMAKEKNIPLTREALMEMGKGVEFFDGVTDWFARINEYGEKKNIEIRHYIISCGLKSMIEGCSIAKEFHNIFACDYLYDENGNILWPREAIDYTAKTQYLYRINKGAEDIGDDKTLNMRMARDERVVPFHHMIYFGDGLTDVPSMKLIRSRGGYAIGVYRKSTDAEYLVNEQRVDFYLKGDYTAGSKMEQSVKAIINKIAAQVRFDELATKSRKVVNND